MCERRWNLSKALKERQELDKGGVGGVQNGVGVVSVEYLGPWKVSTENCWEVREMVKA